MASFFGVYWARRVADEASVWPDLFVDEAGVADMDAARRACRRQQLVCPDCGGAITATSAAVSIRRRAHFRHLAGAAADADCPGAARMSEKHFEAQNNIARALQRAHPDAIVRLEAVHGGTAGHAGRSDIFLEPPGRAPLCVEVQYSTLPVADLQERNTNRTAAGHVIDWVFIVDHQAWTKPLELNAMLNEILRRRGYLYLLEDPMSREPRLRIAVAPWISSQIPDLRNHHRPKGHVHFLRVARRVADFAVVGSTPGAAGLYCQGLHNHLARWMSDSQRALDRTPPRLPPRQAAATEHWQADHEQLEQEAAGSDQQRHTAKTAFHQASADATAATASAAAATAAAQTLPPAAGIRRRRRDQLLDWFRPRARPHKVAPAADVPDRDAEHLAAAARARMRSLRDELTRLDAAHQTTCENLAVHAAQRSAAEANDDARHAEACDLARTKLRERQQPRRTLVDRWLLALPRPPRNIPR
jgi:hypothetical protein